MTRINSNPTRRGGFSLVELLMGIFILGIGIISVAALFPAGIAQQRQSVDDVVGTMVANNALSVIRSRVSQADFGSPMFGPTVPGDWFWSRPAVFLEDTTLPGGTVARAGTISLFLDSTTSPSLANTTDTELAFYATEDPPVIFITQGERAYPMYSERTGLDTAIDPQYFWECMFRRYGGRVYVAIFVYRVTNPPGDRGLYSMAVDALAPEKTAIPRQMLLASPTVDHGPWDVGDQFITGVPEAANYDVTDPEMSWQEPRQWLLDTNNNIHRVLSTTREPGQPVEIELVRPVPPIPNIRINLLPTGPIVDVVSEIYYVPRVDSAGRLLTPVYLLVEEL